MIKKSLLLSMTLLGLHALTLDEAIKTGLKNAPDYLMQENKILLSQEAKNLKSASNYGKIALTGGYTYYNIPRTRTPIVPPISPNLTTSNDISSLGVAYDVNLFSGFSGLRDVEIASLSSDASQISLKLSRQQLIYNIRSLFLKILSLKSQKVAATSYHDSLKKLHEIVNLSVKLGKKPKVDVLKIKADLEAADVNIQELSSNIEILKASLAAMIGIEKVTTVEDIQTHNNDTGTPTDITTLDRYKLAMLEEKKGEKKLQNAKSTYYPKLNLNGYYGSNYADDEHDEIWQVGLGLNWVLFDFGARKAMVQKAKIEKLQNTLQAKKVALNLQKDLQEAKARVDIAANKLKSATTQLALTKETTKIEQERYKQGVGTIYDLLFAKSRYQNARSNKINATYTLQSAIFYYKYITENGEKN